MSTLDLHGTRHTEVEDKLTRYFFWDKPGQTSILLTGNSKKMQLVFEWLDKYEYKYYIPSHNLGEIKIVE